MAYVVAEPCINCKYTDCVEVCPVDCFYNRKEMLMKAYDDYAAQVSAFVPRWRSNTLTGPDRPAHPDMQLRA